ncbi:uncharacterized protein [Montipora foliosa]|uniref:uncharacterized protein n=1 Tax=Montipora foliosa TaxID=591990 RepID=UPI0035F1D79D
MDNFRSDIASSVLCNSQWTSFEELAQCYDTTLSQILDKHAPVNTKILTVRSRVRWFSLELKKLKITRRKLQKKMLKSRSLQDKDAYREVCNNYSMLLKNAKQRLFEVVKKHFPSVQGYADDTQLYVSFRPDSFAAQDQAIKAIENCIADVRQKTAQEIIVVCIQPLLWDILLRARMSPNLLIGDIEKAFLQIGIKVEDRDAFRFLFTLRRKEQFRFTRVPFGAESSPFILGATLSYHYNQYEEEFKDTTETLRENTYVDNFMTTGHRSEELKQFKEEATEILENARFPVDKWESNPPEVENSNKANPGKILGHNWDKAKDTIELSVQRFSEEQGKVTFIQTLAV